MASAETGSNMYEPIEWHRYWVDLGAQRVRSELVPCRDLDDLLGGIARGFRLLEDYDVRDPYAAESPLIMNLGILSGTQLMTGLRTYFHAYSPLKTSKEGMPSAMWSAGSGKFGTKLRFLGVEEIIFSGRADRPVQLHITREDKDREDKDADEPRFVFEDAGSLVGKTVKEKIQQLHENHPQAHFAVIGPAGESFEHVRFAAIALSTENQLKTGDPKPRFCGRGGMGSVMGSKNLLAIIADGADGRAASAGSFKEINKEIARGRGSMRFRDESKGGHGGTWANVKALHSLHAMPEMNFRPTGTDRGKVLYRGAVEGMDEFAIKDEACYRCGIRCHKNVYDADADGAPKRFRAKLDYEPLDLLSANIGIYDVDQACTLVELVDELGMDSISLGVTLSYAMQYNEERSADDPPVAGGLSFGDFSAAQQVIEATGRGRLPEIGQGTKRLAAQTGRPEFAMHSKGVEFPAYLPQTNPGYPWALAGGHMSMRTYLLVANERMTELADWVDAITNPQRGLSILRDDVIGICKFAGLSREDAATAISDLTGIEVTPEALDEVVLRTFLRGYRLEKRQGFSEDDYALPAQAHDRHDAIDLPYFNNVSFFAQLRRQVLDRFDALLEEHLEGAGR